MRGRRICFTLRYCVAFGTNQPKMLLGYIQGRPLSTEYPLHLYNDDRLAIIAGTLGTG